MIAVITPTIPGRQKFLAECIQAISLQMVKPYIHLIQMNYDGCNSMMNYNRAIRKALSDPKVNWVAWCADDDVYYRDHIEALTIASRDADVVYSGYRYMVDGIVADQVCHCHNENLLQNTNYITNPMIHRKVFKDGWYMREDTLDADWRYYKWLAANGYRFKCTGRISFDYVDHINQTHKKGLDHYES